ncbi:MAG: hypothetical protein H8E72_03570 [Candidatus Marinimicrobia bacterium]|nr:hypothetical protein [Candidatus Neomarinimicrobiota bacterium]
MQRRNTIMIWVVSALIIVFMWVSVSPEFRHKIRQFIGDDTTKYYLQTISIPDSDSTSTEIVTHTIVKLNNRFIGHSKEVNELIMLESQIDLNRYVNSHTQNCSSCHQGTKKQP